MQMNSTRSKSKSVNGEARRYKELGGSREADSQSAVLPRKSRRRQRDNQ
jgi:hypothetical protein